MKKNTYLAYKKDCKDYRIYQRDLENMLHDTNECLMPSFNIRMKMLSQLLQIAGDIKSVEQINGFHLANLGNEFPGITKETIERAIDDYHNYAAKMYYI